VADQAMHLKGVGTHQLRELNDLVGVLQMSHQDGADIRWGRRNERGGLLGRERVLASMGEAAEEADGVRAGGDGDG
jgi:hypothetical protein